jgi:hypothetical protein
MMYGDSHSFYNNEAIRKGLKIKVINLNLYNGIVDIRDLSNVVNPSQIEASYVRIIYHITQLLYQR